MNVQAIQTQQRPAADDCCGTFRDTGNVTNLPEDRPEAHVNRYFIKWAPSFDRDEERPWVAINHEAGLQRMPNDLMDRYPLIEAAEVQRRLTIGRFATGGLVRGEPADRVIGDGDEDRRYRYDPATDGPLVTVEDLRKNTQFMAAVNGIRGHGH